MDEDAGSAGEMGYAGLPKLDVEEYLHYVDDFDLTEERKVELLETLWSIMYAFVQMGHGVDSIHRCLPALAELTSEADSDGVEKGNSKKFNAAAAEREDE